MMSSIFYFTGTGNSLYVARQIAAGLRGAALRSLSGREAEPSGLVDGPSSTLDVLGIVSPVHFQGLPRPVKDRIPALARLTARYVFFVATHAGGPGHAMKDAARLLRRHGSRLDYAGGLRMSDNYCALVNLVQPREGQERRLRDAQPHLKVIVDEIASRTAAPPAPGRLTSVPEGALSSLADRMYRAPSRFRSTDACDSCGTCTLVSSWNSFLTPLLVLNTQCRFTLPRGVMDLMGEHAADLAAGAIKG